MKIDDYNIQSNEIFPSKYFTIDAETTGVAGRYPHCDFSAIDILQIGAITANANLETLQEYDLHSILSPDVSIAPEALLTHKLFNNLDKGANAVEIFAKFEKIIQKEFDDNTIALLSYNGAAFDLPLYEHQLYLNLQPPYNMKINSSSVIDVQHSTILALSLYPEMPRIFNENGNIVTRLDVVADSLGISTDKAHDAVADCHMTNGIFKTFKENFPLISAISSICGDKNRLYTMLESGAILSNLDYLHFKSNGNRGPISREPLCAIAREGNIALCLDLSVKISDVKSLTDQEIKDQIGGSGIFKLVKLNKCPAVSPLICHDLSDFDLDKASTDQLITAINEDYELRGKIKRIWQAKKPNFKTIDRPENQIYSGFPSEKDQLLMSQFHTAINPQQKLEIISNFEDPKYRALGERLIYINHNIDTEFSNSICNRLTENFNRTKDYPKGLTNQSALARTREIIALGEFKGKKLSTSDIEGLKKLESILMKREKFIEKNKEFSNE